MNKTYSTNRTSGITRCTIEMTVEELLSDAIPKRQKVSGRHLHYRTDFLAYGLTRQALFRRYGERIHSVFMNGTKMEPYDQSDDDILISFTGKAICQPEDIFDEEIGKRLSYLRAKAHMRAAQGRILADAREAMNEMTNQLYFRSQGFYNDAGNLYTVAKMIGEEGNIDG